MPYFLMRSQFVQNQQFPSAGTRGLSLSPRLCFSMCSSNSLLDDKDDDKLKGPIDNSAEMIRGTADGVVLDAVDGRAGAINCNPLGAGTAS